MFRTIIWILYFWAYFLISIPCLAIKDRKIIAKEGKKWAKRLVLLAGGKISIFGEENIPKEPAIYIANHQGNFDIPIMLGFVGDPRGFMAKIEVKKMPIIPIWMKRLGCVFIDRKNVRQTSLNDAIEVINSGLSLTIFPEGTRNRGNEIKKFKKGAFRIAEKTNCYIVPVTIDGSYKMMEYGRFPFIIKPANVIVTIHKAMKVVNITESIDYCEKIISAGIKND